MKRKYKIVPVIMLLAALMSSIPVSAQKSESKEDKKDKLTLKLFDEYDQAENEDVYIDNKGNIMMNKDYFMAFVYLQMDNPGMSQSDIQRQCKHYLKDGKTYICLNEVSKRLGIYAEYNAGANVVTITKDPYKSMERLASYELTLPERAVSYEKAAKYMDKSRLEYLYGSNCVRTKTFSDAVINLDNEKIMQGLYTFPALNMSDHYDTSEGKSLYRDVLKEAIKETRLDTQNMHVRFIADENGIYKNRGMSRLTLSVRGTFVIWIDCNASDLSVSEIEYACRCGFTNLSEDKIYCVDADVHMNMQVNHAVSVNSIVSLGNVEDTSMYEAYAENESIIWRFIDEK